MTPQSELYDELMRLAAQLDREAFVDRFAGYYLLGQVRDFDAGPLAFNTGKLPSMPNLASGAVTRLRHVLWRLKKSERNAFMRRISVGRAKNNDVVIRHHSISKLHAHFHPPERGRGTLTIADVGSENGTRVNGSALVTDRPTPVKAGDEITFGGTSCQLHDAASLHEVLRRAGRAS